MSIFGDYKAYKKYEPAYPSWKNERDLIDAKRQEYLRQNPNEIKSEDLQRGKILLRAIDVMDEYSQKRAEDMEVATDTAVGYGIDFALLFGGLLGATIGNLKPVKNFLNKALTKTKINPKIIQFIPAGFGALVGVISAFPMFAWASKAEVAASRRGRFEAMRKELNNPKSFAILNDEQKKEVEEKAKKIQPTEEKNSSSLKSSIKSIKEMAINTSEYKKQRKLFESELAEQEKHINDAMSLEEIEKAKKDQQLLTKLVEKIDIASQDYAENAELATQTATTILMGLGALGSLLTGKILNALKVKSANKITAITQILSVSVPVIFAMISARIQKDASRVGRFKVKQELLNNPEQLAYVSNEKTKKIKDIEFKTTKKTNMIDFLKNAWENQKEYKNYKKENAKKEEKIFKAMEQIELTPEQLKDAKTLQRNTFKTFNKVDEKSQKYSESIEALGQAISLPISLLFTGVGIGFGLKFLRNSMNVNSTLEKASNFSKYIGMVLLSSLPSIGINAYITKQQKKASRIANMLAINEMNDYRQFRA